MRRLLLPLAVLALLAVGLPTYAGQDAPTVRAGYGVADATWNTGAAAGQYASENTSLVENVGSGGDIDPQVHSRAKEKSYGTHSRLTVRALVVEGTDGRRVALLKSDNYLAQDLLIRRVGQLLQEGGSGVGYADILYTATHDHSSPYYTTTSPGVFVFQDVFDQRMFEYQARAMRDAIEQAASRLQPARMAATTVPFSAMKANVVGPAVADDGTPAGYPREFGDTGLVVARWEALDDGAPIAAWINFGEHPESLDGYGLTTADYVAPLERFVERDLGAPLVFSQGDVGSSEGPYERAETFFPLPDGTMRAFAHSGYAQLERGARLMADAVVQGWRAAGKDDATVPWSSTFPVQLVTRWTPGPVSQPYPTVGNCRSATTLDGNPGVGVAPDCERAGTPPVAAGLALHGLPVPAHYAAPGYPAVEENTRLKLQVMRLGELLLASCACEAQVDLVLNLETRANDRDGDMWLGFDWSSVCAPAPGGYTCQGRPVTKAAYDRMVAQVANDAKGWDDPAYAPYANTDPADPAAIKGNFTHEELPAARGFALPVALGHAGDYNGYTVSYREYMSRDSYRKALTTYGPHTADYMVTRLVRMAGALKGGPAVAAEVNDGQAQADEARQAAAALAIGTASGRAYDVWRASLPADVGPVAAVRQPVDVQRFDAATFTWRGGSNAVDNPVATVQRLVDGVWTPFADMTGEVQTLVHFPQGVQGVADTETGRQEWQWTAGFEAYDAFPARLGSTPTGTYRFVVDGTSRTTGSDARYHLESASFEVSPWTGLQLTDARPDGSFTAASTYPRSYRSAFRTIADDGRQTICRTCAFRPWATSADVTVCRGDRHRRRREQDGPPGAAAGRPLAGRPDRRHGRRRRPRGRPGRERRDERRPAGPALTARRGYSVRPCSTA